MNNASPYRLYALSNAGSLLALVSYPFIIEPLLRLRTQAALWAAGFAVFVLGCAACARRAARTAPAADAEAAAPEAGRPARLSRLLVLLLSACTSALFLAVTNQLCQEVAAVPFLWILPLALYLVTFMICFDRPRWYHREAFLAVSALATLAALVAAYQGVKLSLPRQIAANAIFLFLMCMTCHGELARLRPAPRHLTGYFLTIALGGALGGAFVAVAAPLWFRAYWEFHIVLLAAWILLVVVWARDRESPLRAGSRLCWIACAAMATFLALRFTLYFVAHPLIRQLAEHRMAWSAAGAVAAAVAAWGLAGRAFARSVVWTRLLVGTVVFLVECFLVYSFRAGADETLRAARNFYGVVRVGAQPGGDGHPPILTLSHGTILHGLQALRDPERRLPLSYYGPDSGIDLALRHHPRRTADGGPLPLRIGVLGLGVGTMAAHARPGDSVRFYEINPAVIDLSAGPKAMFSYVADSPGEVSCAAGDARLVLERELATGSPQGFDVLVMDAFSSDAIPVHLLTAEAFRVYLAHLRDGEGVIAVNISNRFVDLQPPLLAAARAFGLQAFHVAHRTGTESGYASSMWFLLAKGAAWTNRPGLEPFRVDPAAAPGVLWTDDFSNLMSLLK